MMNENFWEGGAAEYSRVLSEEFDQKKKELSEQIGQCNDEFDKSRLQHELDQAQSEYKRKINEIDQSLF